MTHTKTRSHEGHEPLGTASTQRRKDAGTQKVDGTRDTFPVSDARHRQEGALPLPTEQIPIRTNQRFLNPKAQPM